MSQFAKVSARAQIRQLQKRCDGLTMLTQVFLNRLGDSVTVTNAELRNAVDVLNADAIHKVERTSDGGYVFTRAVCITKSTVVEHAIHTQPMGLWPASGDPRLDLMEPGDMNAILRKVKLI